MLGEGRASEERCAVGSLKPNLGHLEAASGIAGVVKVALALDRGAIPPTIHFEQPNPHAKLDELPLAVQTDLGSIDGAMTRSRRGSIHDGAYPAREKTKPSAGSR